MKQSEVVRRLQKLVQLLRSGQLNQPGALRGDAASKLLGSDPPAGWNWLDGHTWSEKWVISMSLGPWRAERTEKVKNLVLKALRGRRLSELARSRRLPFPELPGDWQWEWTIRLAEYLRARGLSDRAFFGWLRQCEGGGLGARAALRAICGDWGVCKTIDYFVREALDLEVIPIDRHVNRILRHARLADLPQEVLITACNDLGIKAQRLARALYRARTPVHN
jgi:hypothetical protein